MGLVCGTNPHKDTIGKQARAKLGFSDPFGEAPMFALVAQGVGRRSTLNEMRRRASIDSQMLEADWRSTNQAGLPFWLAQGLP